MVPPTQYARRGELHVAYQVTGQGPVDVVFLPAAESHVEARWEEPRFSRVLDRLASFSRLILMDRCGTGLSDPLPPSERPSIDEWCADVKTVLDDMGSRRVALVAHGDAVPTALTFAAVHPGRALALVLCDGYARQREANDYPIGLGSAEVDQAERAHRDGWGRGEQLRRGAPGLSRDDDFVVRYGRYERLCASPGRALASWREQMAVDVRPVLDSVSVPVLVLHHEGGTVVPLAHGRYLADHLPDAPLRVLPGSEALWFAGEPEEWISEVEEFLTGRREAERSRRVLTTLLFTDIVSSTQRAVELGDGDWNDLRLRHDDIVRQAIRRFAGRELETAGDEFLASFDGTARAVQCACAIRDDVRAIGLEVRAGVHAGEVEERGNTVSGIGVHLAHRVLEHAQPSEVLVSRTVTDLVTGSSITFDDRGSHELRGIPGTWELAAVRSC